MPRGEQLQPRKRPTQTRARERVDAILRTTAELIEELPLDRITTALIAERASVPIGSVYQYFPNKLGIVAELARHVMQEADRAIEKQVLQDFGVLPWDEAVERTVDVVMQAYTSQPGYVALLRSLRPTQEFAAITDESNRRVAELFAAHPAIAKFVPADKLTLVTRTAVQAANALQDWALAETKPVTRRAIVEEMKTLLKAYLSHYATDQSRG